MIEELLWTYAILPAQDPLIPSVPGISGEHRYVWVEDGALAALTSVVPCSEYEEEALQTRLQDANWLLPRIEAYGAVIAELASRSPVLPLKFGTIFRGQEALRQRLRENHSNWAAKLAKLGGHTEWGLKIYGKVHQMLERRVAEEVEAAEKGGMSPGRLYFLRKTLQSTYRAAIEAQLRQLGLAVQARLAAEGWEHRLQDPTAEGPRPDGAMLVHKVAYLVPKACQAVFLATLAELQEEYAPSGIALAVSGPWAPFSFADD